MGYSERLRAAFSNPFPVYGVRRRAGEQEMKTGPFMARARGDDGHAYIHGLWIFDDELI